jgi:hypothetical protein
MFTNEDLQKIVSSSNSILCDIMTKNNCDKATSMITQHHNYSKLYNRLFEDRRHEVLNVLEIGIGSVNQNIPSNMCGGNLGRYYKPGASIRSWLEYFPNAHIHACDVDPSLPPIFNNEPRVTAFFLDQRNSSIIDNILQSTLKNVEFDIIIDDGLHYFPINCQVMNKLLHKVKKGGFYIIEDVIDREYERSLLDNDLLIDKNYQFVQLPNVHNTCDNNLFIVQRIQ